MVFEYLMHAENKLVEMDSKDYKKDGSKVQRISIRGVVRVGEEYAFIHSGMFGEYKFSGGKMDQGEMQEETLIREIKEEIGLTVIPASISYIGYARELRKGKREDIFEWISYYYECEVTEERTEPKLDPYEKKYEYKLKVLSLEDALRHNEKITGIDDVAGVERDTEVMRKILALNKNKKDYKAGK